jgi:hypothetical protein
MPTCYANNPPSPYGVTLLPKSPNENTDTYSNWGKTLHYTINGTMMSATFRLNQDETILMLGQTSPRAVYYAYIPYVFDRWYPKGWSSKSSDWSKCPNVTDPNGSRCRIFASLGNPINMLNMKTSNNRGQSFSSAYAHYMGGNKGEINRIQKQSERVGIPKSIQNVFGLSPAQGERGAKLGLTREADGFMHLTRTAFVEDKDEFKDYIYYPDKYITILRITPPSNSFQRNDPFPKNVFKPRISEKESVAAEGLSFKTFNEILENELQIGVIGKFEKTHPYYKVFKIEPPVYENGYDCMDQGMMCNGDNQDTLYPNSRSSVINNFKCNKMFGDKCPDVFRTTLQEDGSDFFILTGVNHNATKRALYSSISMYSGARLESLGGFNSLPTELSSSSYIGSANTYLKTPSHAKYFWAVKVSRKCNRGEDFCVEIAKSGDNSLPLNGSCVFIERSYLDKMEAGPTNDAHVKPTVYHFSTHWEHITSASCNLSLLSAINAFFVLCVHLIIALCRK